MFTKMSGEKVKKEFVEKVKVPEGVAVEVSPTSIKVSGKKGAIEKVYPYKNLTIKFENGEVILTSRKNTQREYKLIKTYTAHLKNMIKGVQEGYTYKLKICSSHFPMKVKLSGKTLKIENFLGEHNPRTVTIKEGANVKIDGVYIIVESHDKELAGQVAADIEQSTRLTNKDRRIFQDGIFIVEKAGKQI